MTAVEDLVRQARRRPIATPDEGVPVSIGRHDIERMIPHRDPFLLVDAIRRLDLGGETLLAERWIDPLDPIFAGHFPGNPVYPGALLVEAMGQASLCLQHLLEQGRTEVRATDRPQPVRLLRVQHALFIHGIRPGDRLQLVCRRLENDGYCVTCAAQVLRDSVIAAVAIMDVFLVEAGAE